VRIKLPAQEKGSCRHDGADQHNWIKKRANFQAFKSRDAFDDIRIVHIGGKSFAPNKLTGNVVGGAVIARWYNGRAAAAAEQIKTEEVQMKSTASTVNATTQPGGPDAKSRLVD
jgi:hypothetical protein